MGHGMSRAQILVIALSPSDGEPVRDKHMENVHMGGGGLCADSGRVRIMLSSAGHVYG